MDEVILVDDASRDDNAAKARELGIHTIIHSGNRVMEATKRLVMQKHYLRGPMAS